MFTLSPLSVMFLNRSGLGSSELPDKHRHLVCDRGDLHLDAAPAD